MCRFIATIVAPRLVVSYYTFASCVLDNVDCGSDEYKAYLYEVILAGFIYSIGTPALFLYLVYTYKEQGQRGDRTVQKALGWMCTFLSRIID